MFQVNLHHKQVIQTICKIKNKNQSFRYVLNFVNWNSSRCKRFITASATFDLGGIVSIKAGDFENDRLVLINEEIDFLNKQQRF